MSEFSSAFRQSFAIHRAISAAIIEANGSGIPIKVSDVMKHLGPEDPLPHTSELVAAIVSAAREAGEPIVSSEPHE